MKILSIEIIPHKEQRYDTAGDYWWDGDECLQIRVSSLPDRRMIQAIAIHELVEAWVCKWLGIEEDAIGAFDVGYEAHRAAGNVEEPGDDPASPYHLQHGFATAAERIYCAAVGLNWKRYSDAVNSLEYRTK